MIGPSLRRLAAACLLFALAAGQATMVAAEVTTSPPAERHHHHPGCPWEARGEPCPHGRPPADPDRPAWGACPPADLQAPLAAGPELAPPAAAMGRVPAPPAAVERSEPTATPLVRALAPDPRPPRTPLPLDG